MVFYKSADGYIARMFTPISAERIATDPSFARTRENMSEFARAGKGAKLLRTALRSELQKVSDGRANNRLLRELMRVIKTDAVNGRGQRTLADGEATILEGFEFNGTAKMSSTFFAPYTAVINRTTGEHSVSVPAFTPVNSIEAPVCATHYRINAAAVAVDFVSETYQYSPATSVVSKLDGQATTLQNLACPLPANTSGTVLIVVGIEFFQVVNNINYSLNNGAFNALVVAKVD